MGSRVSSYPEVGEERQCPNESAMIQPLGRCGVGRLSRARVIRDLSPEKHCGRFVQGFLLQGLFPRKGKCRSVPSWPLICLPHPRI